MRRLTLILSALIFVAVSSRGQAADTGSIHLGYPVYSQYLQNGLMINPAYTGSRGALSAFLSYRKQWMNMPGSPVIQSVSLHTPLKNDKVALGLLAQFMQYGRTRSSSLYASYAYHIRIGEGKLSFGLRGGFDRAQNDYSGILLTNLNDPVFKSNEKPYFLPNVSSGVYYFNNKFFAGLSVPSFLSYKKTSSGDIRLFHNFSNYDLVFSAGGLISFSDFVKFKPSLLADYSMQNGGKMNQLDLNVNIILGDFLWIGGSWRTTEQVVVAIAQVQINPQLMFGLSYDYPAGRMKNFKTGGSTEVVVRYEFGYKISASNPRYF
ncbi:MAG TPA: PorP/SprF family type IX secretion system membrane protein [Bacteroidales bacterium]|nr:PorP/SprF family type IX secretion system membrane protein [Bacteroidales bacterium]